MEQVWLNGRLVQKADARISPDDRGFLFADGVYEVVRWYPGFFLGMKEHITRLNRSLREMRIQGFEAKDFEAICEALIQANMLQDGEALVYLEITRGTAPRTHHFPPLDTRPTVYGFARKFVPDKPLQEKGVGIIVKPDIRWLRCDIKSVSLLGNVLSYQDAKEKGMQECVFSRNGFITEASHSNIFFVRHGRLVTHPESNLILSGITRLLVIRLAHSLGIPVDESALPEQDIWHAEEAFLSSTSAEVTPVIQVEDKPLGGGLPGPITRRLMDAFSQMLSEMKAWN